MFWSEGHTCWGQVGPIYWIDLFYFYFFYLLHSLSPSLSYFSSLHVLVNSLNSRAQVLGAALALGTVVGFLRGIDVNLGVAYLENILVIFCQLIVLAHMVIVVTIRMFELVILNGYSFQRRYREFHFFRLLLIERCNFEPQISTEKYYFWLRLGLLCRIMYCRMVAPGSRAWGMRSAERRK